MAAAPRTDRWLLALCAVLLSAGWALGFARTAAEPSVRLRSDGRLPPRRITLGQGTMGGGAPLVQLPAGVSIDPVSGALVGLALEAEPGVTPLPWEILRGYDYQPGLEGLPTGLQELDGTMVVMMGFLMPDYAYDGIREFTLVESHWSCCYGMAAGLNGTVHVNLAKDAPSLTLTLQPLRVKGTLRVREEKDGRIVFSIFALDDATATVLGW